ncbi:MAG: WYL domain-containing protein [Verrucomicrobiae bacterium]|nr:WYL domain-containing protein [Verrucomicrobiae bacterium]
MDLSDNSPEAWAAQERLRFIERALFWRGQLKRKDVREGFGISLAHASGDFQRYFEMNPSAARYDLSAKCYKGLPEMECVLHVPRLEEALALYMGGGSDLAMVPRPADGDRVTRVALPVREASMPVQRAVFQATLYGMQLRVEYGSMTGRRETGDRWIRPQAFAHDGYRWHVRAWCEENHGYRDFVLSRIRNCTISDSPATATAALPTDEDWETWETLTLIANPELPADQRETVEADFGMVAGKLEVRVRRAMRDYTLAHLRLPAWGEKAAPAFLHLENLE